MMKKEKKKWQAPEVSYMEAGEALMLTESVLQGWDVPGTLSLEGKGSSFSSAIVDFLSDEFKTY